MAAGKYLPEADPGPSEDVGTTIKALIGRLSKSNLQWTADKLLKGAGAGADPTEIDVPTPGATLTVAETEVFNGTSSTAWTDLDLSGTIGANTALVILKIYSAADTFATAVRRNGDTDNFANAGAATSACGCALLRITDAIHFVVMVLTDTLGKIEWISGSAQTVTIDIMAYIK